MFDILQETPLYQTLTKWALEEGHEKGREAGLQQGLQKGHEAGKLEGLRETLLTIVQARFPTARMQHLAQGQATIINDPAILQSQPSPER